MKHHEIIKHTVLVSLFAMLCSCAPYIGSYYSPKSQYGYSNSHSSLTSNAPIWVLERGGATFNFSAYKNTNEQTVFSLNIQPIHLPEESSLLAKTREDAKAAVLPITIGLEKYKNGIEISYNDITTITDPVRIVMGTYGTNNRNIITSFSDNHHLLVNQYLSLSVALKQTETSSYEIVWPIIFINGQKILLPSISFKWKHGVQLMFLNG